MNIERLPYQSRPGFDCRTDHANCPACKARGEGDHGRSGGNAWFAVAGELADGRRVVLVLEVLLCQWGAHHVPDCLRRPRGAMLALHLQGDETSCLWMESHGGRCAGSESVTYCGADEFYQLHGNEAGDADQSAEFWTALGDELRTWALKIPVIH